MYIATIKNDNRTLQIHGKSEKLLSGNIVKGINTIDSFTFSMLPSNVGINEIHEFTTLVNVYNTSKRRYEFVGRVLYSDVSMSETGRIEKKVTCESFLGFLCDSQQPYVNTKNWTVKGLLSHLIDQHNSQVESYKHFRIGEVTVEDPNDNLYVGIQRKNTWDSIKEKLIDKLGGEIRVRVVDDINYIDYLKEIGETKSTKIALSRNMKAITKEIDPSAYITKLIPLGKKLSDSSEERLDITSVNGGKNYILDDEAVSAFGIHVGYVEFDDVTTAANLLRKGRQWLAENNRVKVKYSITALDLSLLGLDIDDFDVHNSHPIENKLLGIDDIARIIKKNIDICEELKSTIETGEKFQSFTDIQTNSLKKQTSYATIEQIESVAKNVDSARKDITALTENVEIQRAEIISECNGMIISALVTYVETGDFEYFKNTVESQLRILSDKIEMNFSTSMSEIDEVDGNLQSKFTELSKYIRFSLDGIEIGSKENPLKLFLNNDMIHFRKNGQTIGWWDGTDFHTGNLVVDVKERAQFGNYAFIPRSDGSLQLKKVGG